MPNCGKTKLLRTVCYKLDKHLKLSCVDTGEKRINGYFKCEAGTNTFKSTGYDLYEYFSNGEVWYPFSRKLNLAHELHTQIGFIPVVHCRKIGDSKVDYRILEERIVKPILMGGGVESSVNTVFSAIDNTNTQIADAADTLTSSINKNMLKNVNVLLMDGITQFELTSQMFRDCAKFALDKKDTVVLGCVDVPGATFVGTRSDTTYIEVTQDNNHLLVNRLFRMVRGYLTKHLLISPSAQQQQQSIGEEVSTIKKQTSESEVLISKTDSSQKIKRQKKKKIDDSEVSQHINDNQIQPTNVEEIISKEDAIQETQIDKANVKMTVSKLKDRKSPILKKQVPPDYDIYQDMKLQKSIKKNIKKAKNNIRDQTQI